MTTPIGNDAGNTNLKGTIFIVTYGRSGSTLLQSILQTIPGAHIRGENGGALHGLYRSSADLRRAHDAHGKRPQPAHHPWHGMSEIQVDAYERCLVRVFLDCVRRKRPAGSVSRRCATSNWDRACQSS